jgi:hypothetical protein
MVFYRLFNFFLLINKRLFKINRILPLKSNYGWSDLRGFWYDCQNEIADQLESLINPLQKQFFNVNGATHTLVARKNITNAYTDKDLSKWTLKNNLEQPSSVRNKTQTIYIQGLSQSARIQVQRPQNMPWPLTKP